MRQITNYELGILIPLHSQEEVDRVACWERPPQKYVIGRDEPWVCPTCCVSTAKDAYSWTSQIQSESMVFAEAA